jgi:hypothetical protein
MAEPLRNPTERGVSIDNLAARLLRLESTVAEILGSVETLEVAAAEDHARVQQLLEREEA